MRRGAARFEDAGRTAFGPSAESVWCRGLSVSYALDGSRVQALRDVSFAVGQGEFVSLLGPSGCGKTTLLRTLAGFVQPDSGEMHMERGRGLMVFQENGLFPWMTVLENACFGLEMQGVSRAERERRAHGLLTRYKLDGREGAYPHELSLGMKQRVAVMRSFLSNPGLLLMDEPFAALDWQMRLTLQQELLDLWEQVHATVLFVTHDIDEAILLSDRILVFSSQPGTIAAEYAVPFARPRSAALAVEDDCVRLKREILAKFGVELTGPLLAG